MALAHRQLTDLLRMAYSAEKAAALAYIGHASSVKDPVQKAEIKQIEEDEWHHRREVLKIMQRYQIPASRYYELKFLLIGKFIGAACHVIGWFMPFFFAGRLESGNVCEYFRMLHYFAELGITDHHETLFQMGMKEKEHEMYFLDKIQAHPFLPVFERIFAWGSRRKMNDVDLEMKYSLEAAEAHCRSLP